MIPDTEKPRTDNARTVAILLLIIAGMCLFAGPIVALLALMPYIVLLVFFVRIAWKISTLIWKT